MITVLCLSHFHFETPQHRAVTSTKLYPFCINWQVETFSVSNGPVHLVPTYTSAADCRGLHNTLYQATDYQDGSKGSGLTWLQFRAAAAMSRVLTLTHGCPKMHGGVPMVYTFLLILYSQGSTAWSLENV